jgi:mediator of RNA polymerase II transcription subunit 21
MADRLTQLQDCLDQLLTQMYATVRYIDTHHAYSSISGQAEQFTPLPASTNIAITGDIAIRDSSTQPVAAPTQQQRASTQPPSQHQAQATSQDPISDRPDVFQSRLRELAQDLVLKEQQIEALIMALPGVGNSQEAQEARLVELERELREVELDRVKWEGEREKMRERLEGWIGDVRRV